MSEQKCPKCGEKHTGEGTLNIIDGRACLSNQVAQLQARIAELEGEFDKLLRSMFRIRALAMRRETCDARAVMDEFHRVAGFYNEPSE